MRLGIDTGGTYTDAVLLDEAGRVVAAAKAETTRVDLSLGIGRALDAVLAQGRFAVELVGLSTTLATNAVVEGRGARAGLVLIGFGPELLERGGLRGVLGEAPVLHVTGGHDAHGREIAPLDAKALRDALPRFAVNVEALAVCAQFAVRNPAHERAAADLVAEASGLPVTLSTSLSARLDAPRRALTALLNARLLPFVAGLLDAVAGHLDARGITAPLMVVKGDGSLMAAEVARARPVETVLSGPAASVVGACHLTALTDAVVSDVGGTTTDVAVLRGGRPALHRDGAMVGGRRTMVEAVDMVTVGLGGDSRVGRDAAGEVALGPERAVPLALLARLHPEILPVLAAERARPPKPLDAAFALAQVPEGVDPGGFRKSQRALLALLERGPRPLAEIIEREHLGIPLKRLNERGLVLLSGFTPSDAAHVLGLQDVWEREAAEHGAVLEARKAGGGDARAFAAAVLAEARRRSAAVLLEAVLPGDEPLRALLRPPLKGLVRHALAGGSGGGGALGFRLGLPVVAVGGPARLFYPEAAAALGAELAVPERFAVANAVGAVAGEVAGRATVTATRRGEDRLVAHLPDGPVETPDVEAARLWIREAAAAEAERRARAAGAASVAVEVEEEIRRATLDAGKDMVMEITARATARGRPRLGSRILAPEAG